MKKYLTLLTSIVITLSMTPNYSLIAPKPVYAETKKTSLAVIDFDNNSGIKEWDYMTKGVPRILIANLAKNRGIKIVEREKLDKGLKELNFSQTGLVSPETARKLGKLIGADYALFGSITKFGSSRATIVIDATIMDVQTGEIKFVESVRGNDENAIINLLDKLSLMVLNDLVPNSAPPENIDNPVEEPIVNNNPPPTKQEEPTYIKKQTASIPAPAKQEIPEAVSKLSLSDRLVFTAKEAKNPRQIYISSATGVIYRISNTKSDNVTPVWSPDGTKIAYVNSKFGLSIFDVKTNNTVVLSDKPVADANPKWTPDSNKIVFETKENNMYAIYITNKDGSNIKPLSPEKTPIQSFDVSRYGKIVYSAKVKGENQLFTMNLDGSNLVQLTNDDNNEMPTWSPDGTKIAFSSDRTGIFKTYLIDANGSNLLQLTNGNDDEETPVWSPDGTKIAFLTVIKNKGKVSVINSNGTNQRILITDNSNNYDLSWLPNSKDLGFTYDGNIYTINVNTALKTVVNVAVEDKEEPDWK